VLAETLLGVVGPTVVVFPADGLDGVVGEVRARRHQRVDVAVSDEIGDDPAHPRGHHRARQREEHGAVVVREHLCEHVARLVDRRCADPRVAVPLDQLPDGHPGRRAGVSDRVLVELLVRRVAPRRRCRS